MKKNQIKLSASTLEQARSNLRKLGYQLAVREIYGENTPGYYDLKFRHRDLLDNLYKVEKRA
jgi:hypothetical protein